MGVDSENLKRAILKTLEDSHLPDMGGEELQTAAIKKMAPVSVTFPMYDAAIRELSGPAYIRVVPGLSPVRYARTPAGAGYLADFGKH